MRDLGDGRSARNRASRDDVRVTMGNGGFSPVTRRFGRAQSGQFVPFDYDNGRLGGPEHLAYLKNLSPGEHAFSRVHVSDRINQGVDKLRYDQPDDRREAVSNATARVIARRQYSGS